MRFRFQCPACDAILRGPISAAGKKVSCLKCGQRILIPQPPQKKTMLARLVFGESTAPATRTADQTDAPPESIDEETPSRLLPFLWALVVIGITIVVALGWHPVRRWMKGGAVNVAEVRAGPRTSEEELAKKHILANANDPKSIEFSRWGPHVENGITWPVGDPKANPAKMLHVTYREKNEFGAFVLRETDLIVQNGKVVIAGEAVGIMMLANKLKDQSPPK